MPQELVLVAVAIVSLVVLTVPLAILFVKARAKVPAGTALVVTRPSGRTVAFEDTLVVPFVARAIAVDISLKSVEIRAVGKDALVTHDRFKVDVSAVFHVRVEARVEDVLQAVSAFGEARVSSAEAVADVFGARFRQALATVVSATSLDG